MPVPDASQGRIHGIDPRTGERIGEGFAEADRSEVARLCEAAAAAFQDYRETSLNDRAAFLERIAEEIAALGDELVQTASRESGLPTARTTGETGRTMGQLRLFAEVVRRGDWIGARIDSAVPDRAPARRPDLRLRQIPLGPVAVFGASNFPLAFSVAGGDTASALAAGCPVVVKAHPAHPQTSELVAGAVARAVKACGLPAGTFGCFQSSDNGVAGSLVADPRIKAVGFTGSRAGGQALVAIAAARPEPIPVYAEMSSINPVIILPAAAAARGTKIAADYAASLSLGVGQFCTNPGLMLVLRTPASEPFLASIGENVGKVAAGTMLTPGIHANHAAKVAEIEKSHSVELVGRGTPPQGPFDAAASVFRTSAAQFANDPKLGEEVFGPTGLVVECDSLAEMRQLIEKLEGQLTIAIHMDPKDYGAARELLPLLELKAGRILANGFGTGVEVAHAMVHGGPVPATSDGRSTSVGSLAIERFLRPVCYQDLPAELLPEALRDENPAHIARFADGAWQR